MPGCDATKDQTQTSVVRADRIASHSLAMTVRHFAFARGTARFRVPETPEICPPSILPQPERSARARRTIQRLAVRAGEGDRRTAEEVSEGLCAVRDRLRAVGTAAYRHLRRGRAHHHGAPCVPRADRGKIRTRLLAFSDDMDGLRKVPDNVPNQEMLEKHLGKPLTTVPDPFGTHESFGAHNNARLRAFLDTFEFEYEFTSSTDYYNPAVRCDAAAGARAHRRGDGGDAADSCARSARRPIRRFCRSVRAPAWCSMCRCGARREGRHRSPRRSETGARDVPVTGGHCKLQWKPDLACAGPRSASTMKCTART